MVALAELNSKYVQIKDKVKMIGLISFLVKKRLQLYFFLEFLHGNSKCLVIYIPVFMLMISNSNARNIILQIIF